MKLIQPCRFAAVYSDIGSGDVFRVVGGEEGVKLADLFRFGVALHRDAFVYFGEHLLSVLGFLHGSEDIAGAYAVHSNGRSEFESHALGQQDDSGLGRVVIGVPAVPLRAVGRGGHQDDAALLLHHAARGFARAEEHAVEVDIDDFFPLLIRDVHEVGPDADAGVRDKDVDTAELRVHFFEGALHIFLFADVADIKSGKSRIFGHRLLGRPLIIVYDKYFGSLPREYLGGGQADAACRSRDHNSFFRKFFITCHNVTLPSLKISMRL